MLKGLRGTEKGTLQWGTTLCLLTAYIFIIQHFLGLFYTKLPANSQPMKQILPLPAPSSAVFIIIAPL